MPNNKKIEEETENAATVVGDVLRSAGEQIDAVSEKITNKTQDFVGQSQEWVNTVQSQSGEYIEKMMEYIEDKPLKSVLIAAGIGLLLGKFCSKSKE